MKTPPAQLPAHLRVFEGDLYDERKGHFAPIRECYSFTFSRIETVSQLKATLRNGAYAWPGGYPLYFVTSDGAALSFDSVRAEFRQIVDAIRTNDMRGGWRVIGCEVNWEDGELTCEHSGKRIPSAYAEDTTENE